MDFFYKTSVEKKQEQLMNFEWKSWRVLNDENVDEF